MKMKLRRVAVPMVLVFITMVAVVRFRNHFKTDREAAVKAPSANRHSPKPIRPAPGVPAMRPPDPASLQNVPSHPMAVSFGKSPDLASREPSTLLEILQFYRQEFGSFPTGEDNASIMYALMGNNPSGLPVFPARHPRLTDDGTLLDAWGKPFIFHSISSQQIEVRSVGPDGVIFTGDDICVPVRPGSPQPR